MEFLSVLYVNIIYYESEYSPPPHHTSPAHTKKPHPLAASQVKKEAIVSESYESEWHSGPLKQRIKWIDCARGFAMFSVVFYHIGAISIGLLPTQNVLVSILISYMIPVFFFISGFMAYKRWQYWSPKFYFDKLANKARVQLLPTAVFFTVWVLIFRQSTPWSSYIQNGLEGFWFTFVLFEFFCVYFTLSLLIRLIKGKYFNVTIILAAILGVGLLATGQKDNLVWKTLCVTPFLRYLQFFLLGVLCRKYENKLFDTLKTDWFLTINIIVFIVSIILICSSDNVKMEYGIIGSIVNDIIVRYAGMFIVLSCFYRNKEYFEQSNFLTKILCLIGSRSLDIYLIHNFLLPHIPYFKDLFLEKTNIVLEFWTLAILSILVVSTSLMIGSILRNSKFLSYCLLGVKRINA